MAPSDNTTQPAKSCMKSDNADEAGSRYPGTVCWGDMTVYEFPNILGDNPAVTEGAPLTIGWKYDNKSTVAIDYYEFIRQNCPRRRRRELVLSSGIRDTFLLSIGYSLQELIDVAEETRKIRKSRQNNIKGTTWEKFRNVFERGLRKSEPRVFAAKCG